MRVYHSRDLSLTSFPPSFPFLAVRLSRRGPVKFYHVSDVKGRKMVERLEMNGGVLGLRTARRAKVTGNISHVPSYV